MKTAILLVLGSLLLVSCAPPAPPTADLEEAKKAITAMMEKAEKDMMAGVTDTSMADYTDDAVSMPNNGPFLQGKAAIKEYYQRWAAMGMKFTDVDFVSVDVKGGGKYAYEIGTYTMTIQVEGMEPTTDQGKYLTVYEKGADGKWRIKIETWNTDVQMPETEG